MVAFLRTLFPRRGSATTLLPSAKPNVRLLFVALIISTTFLLFVIAFPHAHTSVLNANGLWWSPGAVAGLASLSLTDLDLGYRVFAAGGQGWAKDQKKLTREVPILDDECLERWVARGETCERTSFDKPVEVDVSHDIYW